MAYEYNNNLYHTQFEHPSVFNKNQPKRAVPGAELDFDDVLSSPERNSLI